MKYWFDTEFIERPCTIDLVSIGIVAEDGREFYAENIEADWTKADEWLLENVRAHLSGPEMFRDDIRDNVLRFIGHDPKPEFWAYYADYDWVVFCWLFGRMVDLPKTFPMFCRDIKQWAVDLGNPKLPEQDGTEHHALADARWNRAAWEFLAMARQDAEIARLTEQLARAVDRIAQLDRLLAERGWCDCGHGPEAHREIEGNCPNSPVVTTVATT